MRSNYLTVEGVTFYAEVGFAVCEPEPRADFNIMYSSAGISRLRIPMLRCEPRAAEVNKHLGVNSELIGPRRSRAFARSSISRSMFDIQSLLRSIIPRRHVRHDVAWGYAAAAARWAWIFTWAPR